MQVVTRNEPILGFGQDWAHYEWQLLAAGSPCRLDGSEQAATGRGPTRNSLSSGAGVPAGA